MKPQTLRQRYFKLLKQHVLQPSEQHLATAADLGRKLIQAGLHPEDLAELHAEALQVLIQEMPEMSLQAVALPMSALQSELLMAYGLYFREKEERLARSLQEKEVLLAEIHHRVKNNLQIMSSLFQMQTRFHQNPEVLPLLQDSQSRIRSMALIHEQLYQTPDFASVNLATYIKTLTDYLRHLYGVNPMIRITYHLRDIHVSMDNAIPCGLILNELISNALKHAFPAQREGEVKIDLMMMPSQDICLTIQDNGCGWTVPPLHERPKSLGLHIVKSLIHQLRGTLDISNQGGTQVKIIFKP